MRTCPFQTYSSYGARFVTIPKYNTNSNSNINHIEATTTWIVSASLTITDRLWHLVSKCELSCLFWNGWFLVHLATKCFKKMSRNQHSRYPYNKIEISTVLKVLKKKNIQATIWVIFLLIYMESYDLIQTNMMTLLLFNWT